MLSIKPLSCANGAGRYFFETEKYYVNEGVAENSGWWGKGAEEFNLSGNVDRQTFSAWLKGELPNGQTLKNKKNGKHRPGIDLTFSAPKSVSIAGLVYGFEDVITCHDEAVKNTLSFIQEHFAETRIRNYKRGSQIEFVRTHHLTAALFRHPMSRANDPQIHTHVIVMNATKSPDGQYRSLSRGAIYQANSASSQGFLEKIFHNKKFLGALYRAELANLLYEKGAEIRMTHQDVRFELNGIPQELINAFSIRQQEIDEALKNSGHSGGRAAAIAAVETNRPKEALSPEEALSRWKETAREHVNCLSSPKRLREAVFPAAKTKLAWRVLPVVSGIDIPYIVGQVPPSDAAKEAARCRAAMRQRFGLKTRREPVSRNPPATPSHAPETVSDTPSRFSIERFKQAIHQVSHTLSSLGAVMVSSLKNASVGLTAAHHRTQEDHIEADVHTYHFDPLGNRPTPGTPYYRDLCELSLTYGVAHLNEREASYTIQDLMIASLNAAHGCIRPLGPGQLYDTIQRWVHGEQLVGAYTFHEGESRLTTPAAIALENDTLSRLRLAQTVHQVTPLLSLEEVKQRLDDSAQVPKHFTQGQRAALQLITTTTHRVVGIQGHPGVGKTTMLHTLHRWASELGYHMIGIAASADAAQNLGEKTSMPCSTIQLFLHRLKQAEQFEKLGYDPRPDTSAQKTTLPVLNDKTIVILDEASLVPSFQMNTLMRITQDKKARLIPTGDIKQFGAIEHGKPFAQMILAGMDCAYMQDIVRTKNPQLKAAILACITGNLPNSFKQLHVGGNLIEIANAKDRIGAIVEAYLNLSPAERDETRVATATRRQRTALNLMIQDGLKELKVLRGNAVETHIYESRDLTSAQKTQVRSYRQHDVIRFNLDYKRLGVDQDTGKLRDVKKGEYLTVKEIDPEGSTVILEQIRKSQFDQREIGYEIIWCPNRVAGRRKGAIEVFERQKRELFAGDLIRWTRNDYKQGKTNGQLARVISVNAQKNEATVEIVRDHDQVSKTTVNDNTEQSENPNHTTIKMKEDAHAHWELAYAWTMLGLQGRDCDRILIDQPAQFPSLTHLKAFLTAISRAKHQSTLYTNDVNALLKQLEQHTGEKFTALEATFNAQMPSPEKKAQLEKVAVEISI